jgi:hypothetical protein
MVRSRSLRHPEDAEDGGSRHSDPIRVATDFFAALALRDWEVAVGYVEPRSLVEFRESQLANIVSWAERRDEIRSSRARQHTFGWSSDGVLSAERLQRHGDVRLYAFPGAPTLRELAALPVEIFAARLLAAGRDSPGAYRVFGHVLERDDLAHVAYRPVYETLHYDELDVALIHLRRHDGRWQVVFRQELADGTLILFHMDDPDDSDESTATVHLG